jgi:hypothetical protein
MKTNIKENKLKLFIRKLLHESLTYEFNNFEELVNLLPDDLKDLVYKTKSNPENINYHPEGNTYDHTKIVVNRLIPTGDINLILAGLFHDLGKLSTTEINPKTNQPSAHGHEKVSADLVVKYSKFIRSMSADPDEVYGIVKNHMRIKYYDEMKKSKKAKIDSFPYSQKLRIFANADNMLNKN